MPVLAGMRLEKKLGVYIFGFRTGLITRFPLQFGQMYFNLEEQSLQNVHSYEQIKALLMLSSKL